METVLVTNRDVRQPTPVDSPTKEDCCNKTFLTKIIIEFHNRYYFKKLTSYTRPQRTCGFSKIEFFYHLFIVQNIKVPV